MNLHIQQFHDSDTGTLTYVVSDTDSKDAVIIDPVLDYSPVGSLTALQSVNKVKDHVREQGLKIHYIMETHAHADHLSGAQYLLPEYGGAKLAIGRHITKVQATFRDVFNLAADFPVDGSQFDVLLAEGDVLEAGSLRFTVLHVPGHTPACSAYKIADNVFTGDALFQPDIGVARCDFPAGSAKQLYQSVTQKLYTLPDDTKVWPAHDYPPAGEDARTCTTIGESKEKNVDLPASRSEAEFVAYREAADAKLSAPRLLYQSVQVNIAAGALPEPAANGTRYLNMPVFPPRD